MMEKHILLASNSPRRRELLAWLGWPFTARAMNVDESQRPAEPALAYVSRLAAEKAQAALPLIAAGELPPGCTVVAADTIVVDPLAAVGSPESILGKPAGPDEARAMLRSLRGRVHIVCTALAVIPAGQQDVRGDVCTSRVPMRTYNDAEMEAYIASGDPLDKAGAYAIQNGQFRPVSAEFAGCFASVTGLPLCHLARTLRGMGWATDADIPAACRQKLGYDCPIHAAVQRGEKVG